MKLIHQASAIILLLSHILFLSRGFWLIVTKEKPEKIDHTARGLSHLFLPIAIISGFLAVLGFSGIRGNHLIFPLLVIAATFMHFFLRKIILKSKKLPWLLPVINLFLYIGAFLTGMHAIV